MYNLSEFIPSLFALNFSWLADSSAETYRIFCPLLQSSPLVCKRIVDLPIPGSPAIKTNEPCTSPPPKILSNSDMFVLILTSSPM